MRPSAPAAVRRVRAVLALLALGLGVLLAAPAAPAHAAAPARPGDAGDVVVSQYDRESDVDFLDTPGAGRAARNSIDLRRFWLVEQKTGVRMTLKVHRIMVSTTFNQALEVQMKPADSTQAWFLDVTMSGQEANGATASWSPDLNPANTVGCELDPTVDTTYDTVSVFVPDECLPSTAARIKVFSSLEPADSDSLGYSLDKMRIHGARLVRS